MLWAVDHRNVSGTQLDIGAARQAAQAFLDESGLDRLIETGWRKPETHGNRVVFTFAGTGSVAADSGPVEVVLYPEMVKVEVARHRRVHRPRCRRLPDKHRVERAKTLWFLQLQAGQASILGLSGKADPG